ncbi:MAG: SDR family NAD(P)-dependent oxidoreductase [Proteobacteria bacterium]|nr:MAG: SDR family NAD(P)-dependent oxidoreductase [Pseudomonadota bacterium]|tara:strand:- start:1692 stop:2618 length:927 start_codon:yes stop_codon:yes gene_type:complete
MKNNKVCIVTGASRGLGRGIALVLAREEGCKVYATARNEEALKALAEDASSGSKGGIVKVCKLDQSDDTAVQAFVERLKSEEEQVDLLVNSAFAGLIAMTPHFGKPFWERPLSVFDASINIGLRSAHVMSALVAPLMVKNKAGLLVQVSSFGGVQYLFDVGYGVGKAGLDRLTADMATELKPYNIHAVTLYPGAGVTEVTAFPGGETPVFTGRAVASLLNKATNEDQARMSGKIVQTSELAEEYGFTDEDGRMPEGDFAGIEAAKRCREVMSKPVIQFDLEAKLTDPLETNNPDMVGLFPGAKTYSEG